MKYMTRDFGEVDAAEEEILKFTQPIFGFEDCKRYMLLRDEEIGESIAFLQSLDRREVCFTLFDPSGLSDVFQPRLPPQTDSLLGQGELHCWVIGVVPEDFRETTVNLKSPVFINTETRLGAQMILEQEYPVRYPLMKGAK